MKGINKLKFHMETYVLTLTEVFVNKNKYMQDKKITLVTG